MLVSLYAVVNGFAKIIKKQKFVKTNAMITINQFESTTEKAFSLDEVISLALQHEFVIGARAFEYNDTIVLAVLTTPFCLKSERDNSKLQISDEMAASFKDKSFVVTFDMQVYRNISQDLNESDKARLTELAKVR